MGIVFVEWGGVDVGRRDSFVADLVVGYDGFVAGARTGVELLERLRDDKVCFWLVEVDGELVGVVGLGVVGLQPGHITSSTFILPAFRGRGISGRVKQLLSGGLGRLGVPFGVLVREWNTPSLKAVSKAFPCVVPVFLGDGGVEGEGRFWWDLSTVVPVVEDLGKVFGTLAGKREVLLRALGRG